jgi:hypothetical protein
MQLNCLKEIQYYTSRLANAADFKIESILSNEVSIANKINFERDIQKILIFANELKFITTNTNKTYAEECFKVIQRTFMQVNSVFHKKGTNEDFMNAVKDNTRKILDYAYLIKNNEEDFKSFTQSDTFVFDETNFNSVIDKLVLNRKNERDNFYIFQEELFGGEFLSNAKETLLKNNNVENIHLYGIDRDIDLGINSRKLNINTARKNLIAASAKWADVCISTNEKIYFDDELLSLRNYDLSYATTQRRRLVKRDGIFIFNIPFYKLNDFERTIISHTIEGIYRTDDEVGNLVVVLKTELAKNNANKILIKQAMYKPESLPTLNEVKSIFLDSKEDDGPKTFRAGFIDIDDVEFQFKDVQSSSNFIYAYLKTEDEDEDPRRALQEPKEGHIPTLATSGIVSGRYVDELLQPRYNKSIGFDNLIETKIVKREIEEEQMVSVKGELVKEISLKKSNIIVSTALTPQGEFVELFSNDTQEEDKTK